MINEAPYKLKLYFSNTFVSSDSKCEIAKSTIEALTDVQSYDLYCYNYFPIPKKEGENNGGEGGVITEKSYFRETFEIHTRYFTITSETGDYFTLYNLFKNYNHKYLHEPTAHLGTAIHTTNTVIAVSTTEFDPQLESGLINLTIKFTKRK